MYDQTRSKIVKTPFLISTGVIIQMGFQSRPITANFVKKIVLVEIVHSIKKSNDNLESNYCFFTCHRCTWKGGEIPCENVWSLRAKKAEKHNLIDSTKTELFI